MVNAVDSKPTDASLESSSLSPGTDMSAANAVPVYLRLEGRSEQGRVRQGRNLGEHGESYDQALPRHQTK